MSPRAAAEFTKQWPALKRRLESFLRNKGVPQAEIEDVAQDVGIRLLSFWHKLDADRPTWPLVATIALNLLRDRNRRIDLEVLGEPPDTQLPFDVADAGIARIELEKVFRAMSELTPAQRAALLQIIDGDGPSTSAEKMLRMRARRRLADAVGRACAGLSLKARRVVDSIHAFLTKGDTVAQALACATCLFVSGAGIASMYPQIDGLDGQPVAGESAVTVDTAATTYLDSAPQGVSSEMLRPATAAAPSGADSDAAKASHSNRKQAAPTSSNETATGTTTPGTNVGLPGQSSLPGQAPIPAPPGPGDAPTEAPELEVAMTPPSTVPQPPAGDAPVATVEQVTGAIAEATD